MVCYSNNNHSKGLQYVLVIAQPECNMPYIALDDIMPEQYMACCMRAPAITNLLPNGVKLV